MALQESGEMYLETILLLSRSHGSVRSIDVARSMGLSQASVSRAVHILQDDGYLEQGTSRRLLLTEIGMAAAKKVYERHVTLSAFLKEIGVSDSVASDDACKLEHYMSDETFLAIRRHLTRIRT